MWAKEFNKKKKSLIKEKQVSWNVRKRALQNVIDIADEVRLEGLVEDVGESKPFKSEGPGYFMQWHTPQCRVNFHCLEADENLETQEITSWSIKVDFNGESSRKFSEKEGYFNMFLFIIEHLAEVQAEREFKQMFK